MWIEKIYGNLKKMYSQSVQDGIIENIFKNIGTTNKFCVEFGFNSTTLEGGSGSNTANLILNEGWEALLLDGSNSNPEINLHQVFLTPENIVETFNKYNVPKDLDYLSIDVDSIDLWLLKSILEGGYKPRMFSIEYNANFKLTRSVTVKPGTVWKNGDAVYGASLRAINKVAEEFDYCLIAVVKKLDLFFIRKEFARDDIPSLSEFKNLVGLPTHFEYGPPTSERMKNLVEYPSMIPINDKIKKELGWKR